MFGGVVINGIAYDFFLAFLIEFFFLETMPLTTPPTIGNILGFDLMIPAII